MYFMKNLLLSLAILLPVIVLTSCSKDDEPTEQTFFVNVYDKWEDGDEAIAKNAFVYLYLDENKNIDDQKSVISVVSDGLITYEDGSKSVAPKYATKLQSGVFNMENISNGKYVLWVTYKTIAGARYYSSYKKINVDYSYRGTTEKKVFQTSWEDAGLYIYKNW